MSLLAHCVGVRVHAAMQMEISAIFGLVYIGGVYAMKRGIHLMNIIVLVFVHTHADAGGDLAALICHRIDCSQEARSEK